MSVDHVQVAAPQGCEAEARRFYGTLLGLVEVESPSRFAGEEESGFAAGSNSCM